MKNMYYKKYLKKILWVIPFLLAFSISDFFSKASGEVVLSEFFWNNVFGTVTKGEYAALVLTMESLGVVFLFTLLFGGYAADFFGPNSAVWFTRVWDRRNWTIRQILDMGLFSALFSMVTVFFQLALTTYRLEVRKADGRLLWTCVLMFAIFWSVMLLSCLLTNWMTVYSSVSIGVISSFGLLVLLRAATISAPDNPVNIVCNPLCFNIMMLEEPIYGILKMIWNIAVILIISAGMTVYIEKKDIF